MCARIRDWVGCRALQVTLVLLLCSSPVFLPSLELPAGPPAVDGLEATATDSSRIESPARERGAASFDGEPVLRVDSLLVGDAGVESSEPYGTHRASEEEGTKGQSEGVQDEKVHLGDLKRKAIASMAQGGYGDALSYYTEAVGVLESLSDRIEKARILARIGDLYRWSNYLGQPEIAIYYYQEALRTLEEHANLQSGDLERSDALLMQRISIFAKLGRAYIGLQQFDQAVEWYDRAFEEMIKVRELGSLTMELIVLVPDNPIYLHLYASHTVRRLKEILDRFVKSGDEGYRQYAANQWAMLGNHLSIVGRNAFAEQSFFYALEALDGLMGMDVHTARGMMLFGRASILEASGKRREAVELYHMALWEYEEYLSALNLPQPRSWPDACLRATTLIEISKVLNSLGKSKEALERLDHATGATYGIQDVKLQIVPLNSICQIYMQLTEYEGARRIAEALVRVSEEIGNDEELWRAYWKLAEGRRGEEDYSGALKDYRKALAKVESIRSRIVRPEDRASHMQGRMPFYDQFIDFLRFLHEKRGPGGYALEALEVFECKQGRALRELLMESLSSRFPGMDPVPDPQEAEREIRALTIRDESLMVRQRSAPEDETRDIGEIRKLQGRGNSRSESPQSQILWRDADRSSLIFAGPVGLKGLQRSLHPNDKMLIYNVMEERTLLWLVESRGSPLFFELPCKTKRLADKVRRHLDEITNYGMLFRSRPEDGLSEELEGESARRLTENLSLSGRDLGRELIPEPVWGVLDKMKPTGVLFIVPTSFLYYLPFETVVRPWGDREEGRLDYLVRLCPVVYLSSPGLLKSLKDRRAARAAQPGRPLLVYAAPAAGQAGCHVKDSGAAVDAGGKAQGAALAGELVVEPATSPSGKATVDGIGTRPLCPPTRGYFFDEWQWTGREAEEIQRTLGASFLDLRIGPQASKAGLLALNESREPSLNDYRYIVFLVHGALLGFGGEWKQPALVLSYPDPETGGDGFLRISDVLALQMTADLVTLSACGSVGVGGRFIWGEGVMGLTRAFLYAGARSVAGTLWSVYPEATMRLTLGLHENLGFDTSAYRVGFTERTQNRHADSGPAFSLQRVKVAMIDGEKGEINMHPYYWAPLVMYGEGR